jgi:tRNA dimethylallyltransferase
MSFISQFPHTIGVVGPTAVGKTAVAIELVDLLDGQAEIVSVDSMQVYRHMDIGTAKPSDFERKAVKFWMIDIVDPDEEHTLADFQHRAAEAIEQIHSSGKIAILAGGTGLYFKSITSTLTIPHTPPDPEFREYWKQKAETSGLDAVRDRLIEVDPESSEKIHSGDLRRMIRAIEVFEKTGKPLSEWHRLDREMEKTVNPNLAFFCIDRNRSSLYRVIEHRVDQMMDQGFLQEVEKLRDLGYSADLRPMQALGYRQLNQYVDNLLSLNMAIESIKTETRQFARRQLIWYRADKRLTWLDAEDRSARDIAISIVASLKK